MPHNANRRDYLRPSGPRHNVIKNAVGSTLTWKRIPRTINPVETAEQKPLKPREERRIAQKGMNSADTLTHNPFEALKDLL